MAEVVVVVVIVGVLALIVLMALPRQRESARSTGCLRNLRQIGEALAQYDQAVGHLPVVAELPDESAPGPLPVLFEGQPAPGFVCASDPHATAGLFAAPVSYRATTGDAPEGRTGAFAPGRRVSLAEIEAADGASQTAVFSERLVGDDQEGAPSTVNYARVPGPLSADQGCPPAPAAAWHGDAGSSPLPSNWRDTLYNHALTPNAAPSCIAEDARSALMGASSGHPLLHVLCADGSVREVRPSIDATVWRELAAFRNQPSATRKPLFPER